MPGSRVRLEDNERASKSDAVRIRDVRGDARVEVTVTVREPELPPSGSPLTRDELERRHAVNPDDKAAVRRALGKFGLTVSDGPAATGSLAVRGSAAQIEAA